MEILDIIHYLGVIKDVIGVIETDDPALVQSLSSMAGMADTHINVLTATAASPTDAAPVPPTGNVSTAVEQVMAAAPSVMGLVEKL